MSKLALVMGTGGAQYIALERDDGTLVFASNYVPRDADGIGTVIDGRRHWFVRKAAFAAEVAAAGLQPVWDGMSRTGVSF